MKISEFIQTEVLLPRLREAGVLVVYDPDRRYRELCLALAGEKRRVVDASESSIESREQALAALQELGEPGRDLEELLVYVPARAPLADEEKQRDPFALYAACGAVFPQGDGDEYLSLCLRARADYALEIRRLFAADPSPSFAVIDAVGGGAGWPTLQALLGVESARDILFALLAPSDAQKAALRGQEAWVAEAKTLFQTSLGLGLLARGRTWSAIADELWRFLLFGDFALDLPATLPAALADVPRAPVEARPLVVDLCDRLRNDRRSQPLYIERAEEIERELALAARCADVSDLGTRATFPFQERASFAQAVEALKHDQVEALRHALERHSRSIWAGRGENQAQWQLLRSAAGLIQACEDCERQLTDRARTQEELIDYYTGHLRVADRLQREFEQAAGDILDVSTDADEVIARARAAYQGLAGRVQGLFVRHLESSGWPPAGRLANSDVFDKVVAPRLQQNGRRVALFLIDALRYELGVELAKQLADSGQVELRPAYAQLPTVTPVGMASLLPGAGSELTLVEKGDAMVVALGQDLLPNVRQRMEVLRRRYGERFAEATLSDLRGRFDLPATAELFVVRSNTIDSHLESTPEVALRIIQDSLRAIRAAIRRLEGMGFREVIIATDHGFFLNSAAGPGGVAAQPPGRWLNIHERLLLGDGAADSANYVLQAEHLGIRGDYREVAGPRSMVAYRAGERYLHGGASLQEAVVPVITIRLREIQEVGSLPVVTLGYKRGAKRITTRLPVIDLEAGLGDLFSREQPLEVLVEAHDSRGNVVGEAKPGGAVNAATRTVSVRPGDAVRVILRMDDEFRGQFTVKALDPATLTAFSKLDLETDYLV